MFIGGGRGKEGRREGEREGEREGKRAHKQAGGWGRKGGRVIPSRLHAVSRESNTGLDLTNCD